MSLASRLLFAPFLTQLVVIRRCNLSCGYCNEFDTTSDPVDGAILRARIDKLKELGTFSLEFTGGEPMMHPEINDLIRYARSRSIRKVMMISNAYLMNEKKVKALNDAGLSELQVSVDGVLPNDVTVKVLKPMLPKLKMLAKTAEFKVVLSAVLGAAKPTEVLEVVRTAKELGFRPRVLVLHDGSGQMMLSPGELATLAEVKSALGGRFDEAHDYRERILLEGRAPFKCRAGSRYLYVDEFGDVHWCSQTRGSGFKKALMEYTAADLKAQFYTRKDCAPACTLGCARTQSAYDEWRSQPLERERGAVRLPVVT